MSSTSTFYYIKSDGTIGTAQAYLGDINGIVMGLGSGNYQAAPVGSTPGFVSTSNKTADQALVSTTTFTNITGLSYAIAANASVRFRMVVFFSVAGALSGYKFQIVGPASPTNVIYGITATSGNSGTGVQTVLGALLQGLVTPTGSYYAVIEGLYENGVNAGTIQLQAAQSVSSASALTILRGSSLSTNPF